MKVSENKLPPLEAPTVENIKAGRLYNMLPRKIQQAVLSGFKESKDELFPIFRLYATKLTKEWLKAYKHTWRHKNKDAGKFFAVSDGYIIVGSIIYVLKKIDSKWEYSEQKL